MANTLLSTVNAARQRQPMCDECEKSLPNQIVFDKIESIIRLLQDEQNGLPVKTAKSFMSKIPSVFTGQDLIQWMMRNLKLEDQQEAIHLANLIASHGYIFPIEDHTLSIKNDCTFYRFQTPCLWPSNNGDPENTDYAVYLCKRTMQSKTRLELADYEAENLARLQKMFSRKWEFIFMQAESQAKVDKKRDKLERKVLDSQERAFWDVYRPVPGCVNTTELDIKKACRLSKSAKRCAECQKVAAGGAGTSSTSSSSTQPALPLQPPKPQPLPPTPSPSQAAQQETKTTPVNTCDQPSTSQQQIQSQKQVQIEENKPQDVDDKQSDTIKAEDESQPQQEEPKPSEQSATTAKQSSEATHQNVEQQVPGGCTKTAHHHGHHHHHHHHHHPHPHQHGHHHHHHHHHKPCPHHKHHQAIKQQQSQQQQQQMQQSASDQPQLTIPTESMITTTLAAGAGGWASASGSPTPPGEGSGAATTEFATANEKKRSAGSVDQFMRLPQITGGGAHGSGRRKSECHRILSSASTVASVPTADDLIKKVPSSSSDSRVTPEPGRPASACCSYTNLEVSSAKNNRQIDRVLNNQQVLPARKCSLNMIRNSADDRLLLAAGVSPNSLTASSTGAGGSAIPQRKCSVQQLHTSSASGHSPLKGAQSVGITSSTSSASDQQLLERTDRQHIGDLERELEALKVRLDRRIGGVKMSKVTQSYLSYFQQWADYDPFIAQPIPSNPWISDSTELWDSERQTKDVHCRRVRRWAFSLKELLNDPAGREQFHRFLEKEFSAENLKFWDAVQELKRVHSRDVARRVEAIWTEYLAQDANCPINIDSKSYETSKKNMAKNKNNRCIFDEAAGHVYQLMKNDSYPRYLRSDMYKDYKEASEKKRSNQVNFDVFKPQITTLKHKFNF